MGKYQSFNQNQYSVHNMIINFIKEKKKILDVGCAEGYLDQKINHKNEIIGVEIDSESANIAEKYCDKVFLGNVETIKLPEEYNNYFDIIIFADILEHLKEPSIILNYYLKYLKDDGEVLISLPNIANWKIRLNLLFGNFEYVNKGILDKTHLKFFNLKNARYLIKQADLKIYEFDVTVGDLNRFAGLFHFIGRLWPNLLAYQFFFVTKKI